MLFVSNMPDHSDGAVAKRDVNPASSASEQNYAAAPVRRIEHLESTLTRLIEHQAARIPSDVFLAAAFGAMAASVAFEIAGNTRASRFVGMWPAPLLVMGVYNKMVKLFGSR